MIAFNHTGNFKPTLRFLNKASKINYLNILNKYGAIGVNALSKATPVDTGNTANSWRYDILNFKKSQVLQWSNTNVNKGIPIAILIQYGHGTRNGGYVYGRDYINPALRPILDDLATVIWQEVQRL